MSGVTVRQARLDDHDAVAAFTRDTWSDRGMDDWIPNAFPEWIETDGDDQRTLVATADGEVCGICQGVLLSPDEAWGQALRVHPDYRGRDVARRMTDRLLSWCRNRGATVARNMVFSWNGAGLGQSRAAGFEPATEIRFTSPEPSADAHPADHGPADAVAIGDPAVAWRYWTHSDAREHCSGLALDDEESWALRELTRADLDRAAEDGGAIAITTGEGTVAMAVRSRIDRVSVDGEGSDEAGGDEADGYETGGDEAGDEDSNDDEVDGEAANDEGRRETVAVYGATAWDDLDSCAALVSAIAADAADVGADRTKVLLPETVRHVSDLAACRVPIDDEPEFVLAADLTGRE